MEAIDAYTNALENTTDKCLDRSVCCFIAAIGLRPPGPGAGIPSAGTTSSAGPIGGVPKQLDHAREFPTINIANVKATKYTDDTPITLCKNTFDHWYMAHWPDLDILVSMISSTKPPRQLPFSGQGHFWMPFITRKRSGEEGLFQDQSSKTPLMEERITLVLDELNDVCERKNISHVVLVTGVGLRSLSFSAERNI